jgi:hypothetical protein
MYTTYHLKEEELDEEFLESVKKLFKNKRLTISVSEEIDETAYLLNSSANLKRLKESVGQIKSGQVKEFSDIKEIQNHLMP